MGGLTEAAGGSREECMQGLGRERVQGSGKESVQDPGVELASWAQPPILSNSLKGINLIRKSIFIAGPFMNPPHHSKANDAKRSSQRVTTWEKGDRGREDA